MPMCVLYWCPVHYTLCCFPQALMQFGLGQQSSSGGKFDWGHIQRHMTGRWPHITLDQTTRYAELVMAQLSEPASDKPFFTDGISKKDILQFYELNKVLHTEVRLTMRLRCLLTSTMHLVNMHHGVAGIGAVGNFAPSAARPHAADVSPRHRFQPGPSTCSHVSPPQGTPCTNPP